ncbi:MAG: hypothetical protein Q7R97_03215 [Candidatus Daviesbacteria bacterium]|nr:hypothetical protein [Candidatus Daviesbacteria bacterium]
MINFKIKENRNRILLTLLIFFLISGWFYWFQFRPSQIRHDCSWVKHTTDAIPAKPAMNEEELKVKELIKTCTKDETNQKTTGYQSIFSGTGITQYYECDRRNKNTIEEYKTARPTVSAKDWWRAALPAEYQFCLHDKGL